MQMWANHNESTIYKIVKCEKRERQTENKKKTNSYEKSNEIMRANESRINQKSNKIENSIDIYSLSLFAYRSSIVCVCVLCVFGCCVKDRPQPKYENVTNINIIEKLD